VRQTAIENAQSLERHPIRWLGILGDFHREAMRPTERTEILLPDWRDPQGRDLVKKRQASLGLGPPHEEVALAKYPPPRRSRSFLGRLDPRDKRTLHDSSSG